MIRSVGCLSLLGAGSCDGTFSLCEFGADLRRIDIYYGIALVDFLSLFYIEFLDSARHLAGYAVLAGLYLALDYKRLRSGYEITDYRYDQDYDQ